MPPADDATSRTAAPDLEPAPAEEVMSLLQGGLVAQIIAAFVALDVPETLREAPASATTIARRGRAVEATTYRLLRAGVAIGLVTYDADDDVFVQTPLLVALRKDTPGALGNVSLALSAPAFWLSWGRMTDAVRLGETQSVAALGSPIWEYYGDNVEEGELFGRAITEASVPVVAEAARMVDCTDVQEVVDVGCADGDFVISLLKRHPHVRGIAFDLPSVTAGPRAAVSAAGLDDRCAVVGGDFFASVPPADLYFLKSVLHDWDDEACVRILRNCAASLRPGGRVAVAELVVGETTNPRPDVAIMDMSMLALTSGQERSLPHFDELFAQAGLTRIANRPLVGSFELIEAQLSVE